MMAMIPCQTLGGKARQSCCHVPFDVRKVHILFVPGDSTAKKQFLRRARGQGAAQPSRRYPPAAQVDRRKMPAGGRAARWPPARRRGAVRTEDGMFHGGRRAERERVRRHAGAGHGRGGVHRQPPGDALLGRRGGGAGTSHRPPENVAPGAEFSADLQDRGAVLQPWAASGPPLFTRPPGVGQSFGGRRSWTRVNVIGGLHLLERPEAGVKQFVFASTGGALYGRCPRPGGDEGRPAAESPAPAKRPSSYLDVYRQNFSLSYTVLRYANVYGPGRILSAGGRGGHLRPRLLRGEPVTLFARKSGDDGCVRDYNVRGRRGGRQPAGGRGGLDSAFNVGPAWATTRQCWRPSRRHWAKASRARAARRRSGAQRRGSAAAGRLAPAVSFDEGIRRGGVVSGRL